jgi:hypothetical protein
MGIKLYTYSQSYERQRCKNLQRQELPDERLLRALE